MRTPLTASLFLFLGLIQQINMSFSALPKDLEGSGDDQEISGSGSGDLSEQDETNTKDRPEINDVRVFAENAGGGTKNTFHDSSVVTFDETLPVMPVMDVGSGYGVMANSKSLLERKEIFAGVIAGGVTGAILAASLATILIYKWQKKDDEGYILGQQRASVEDYHRPSREEVV
ncbi:Syndecan-3 Precursor [Collichthys lucidus]|uniref:Syndecan-3 n=1 Tax=Collichthys lucidus TaxID=240159 RepID=A0A4U5UMG1_COLLU|nr:Syndecan-3 Precursor [Collichthys lucidus]